ncbi:unnamed protein product [Spirodela intermedia]|uniref:Matrin-type domain-containing protein n=1 Tax=Spirodela intermedia TaxID=51605 RepID=A0A7I8IPE2_SPIIN|nr:unnamed protein product [Spirodela intermedia]CAA6658870.1 unnamed protein product [Spirodela intermedia]
MTMYWVSQGNKWCDFCKIYISNNPLSIRTHELGKRHKDNVTARLATMRKESAAKEKEKKEAAKALEQIESKAQRSYQKDLAAFEKANQSVQHTPSAFGNDSKGTSRSGSLMLLLGYYHDSTNGYFYEPNSRLYFSNEQEESTLASAGGPPPGLVISKPLASMLSTKPVKGVPSSVSLAKRKRADEKPKVVSKEEAAALRAREAARKRVEEREKHLLGLYKSY